MVYGSKLPISDDKTSYVILNQINNYYENTMETR